MKQSSSYLRRNNMELTGWNNGLPIVRQKPGSSNALGKVKFIFPNRYNIYFHDTPAKSLFEKRQRTFSHGCIRLEKPLELAQHLLRNDPKWTNLKIKVAMNAGSEKWVKLKENVPVFIIYLTAWVDKDGMLNFRDDVYGRDDRIEKHLFR
jgi:murein L,D-transpeptidase YcbB/YkuD